jgi:hypothetical protein
MPCELSEGSSIPFCLELDRCSGVLGPAAVLAFLLLCGKNPGVLPRALKSFTFLFRASDLNDEDSKLAPMTCLEERAVSALGLGFVLRAKS